MTRKIKGVHVDAQLKTVEADDSLERVRAEITKPDPDNDEAIAMLKAGKSLSGESAK